MDTSPNFDFLTQVFPPVAESASFAELHINGDPRAACFHARHALERLVKRLFKIDKQLKPQYVQNLDGYMSDETFVEVACRVDKPKAHPPSSCWWMRCAYPPYVVRKCCTRNYYCNMSVKLFSLIIGSGEQHD